MADGSEDPQMEATSEQPDSELQSDSDSSIASVDDLHDGDTFDGAPDGRMVSLFSAFLGCLKPRLWSTRFLVWCTLSMKMTYSVAADPLRCILVSTQSLQTEKTLQHVVNASELSKIGRFEITIACHSQRKVAAVCEFGNGFKRQ